MAILKRSKTECRNKMFVMYVTGLGNCLLESCRQNRIEKYLFAEDILRVLRTSRDVLFV